MASVPSAVLESCTDITTETADLSVLGRKGNTVTPPPLLYRAIFNTLGQKQHLPSDFQSSPQGAGAAKRRVAAAARPEEMVHESCPSLGGLRRRRAGVGLWFQHQQTVWFPFPCSWIKLSLLPALLNSWAT